MNSDTSKRPIVVLACQVLQDLFERFVKEGQIQKFIYLDYGLHSLPRKLTQAVQEALDDLAEPSLVILGYGLCGNGLNGIRAGKHSLLIARADDCIAIFLGTYERYQHEFKSESGTYYLTKGWLESGSNPLQEYQKYVVKYGLAKANWLIDSLYHNYKRVVLVAHSQTDLEAYHGKAMEVAKFCERWGMHYQEILGSSEFFEHLLQAAFQPELADENFILVPPGGMLRQDQFKRMLS
jgi:Protein of unknown function (DUF1638)